jgi:hypothetical protein
VDLPEEEEEGGGQKRRCPRLPILGCLQPPHREVGRGNMKSRVGDGSVRVFIPHGTIGGLFWTMGRAINSNEAKLFLNRLY